MKVLLSILALVALGGCGTTVAPDADRANTTVTYGGGYDEGRGPDPADQDLIYACGSFTVALDDLLRLGDLPRPDAAEFELAATWQSLGDVDQWARVSPGVIVDHEPVASDPPALVFAPLDGDSTQACVPTRDVGYGHYPLAWRLQPDSPDDKLAIELESCVNPDSVVSDVREIEGDVVVWLFGPRTPGESCVVDGSVTLELERPESGGERVLSGHTWPFAEADPARAYFNMSTSPVVEITDDAVSKIRCRANSSTNEVFVEWWDLPPGLRGELLADNVLIMDFDSMSSAERADRSIADAFAVRMVSYGNPPSDWGIGPDVEEEPQRSDGGRSNFAAATGVEQAYAIMLKAPGFAHKVSCGTAGVPAELPVPECSIVIVGGHPSLKLSDTTNLFSPTGPKVLRDGEPLSLPITFGGPIDTTAETGARHHYEIELFDSARRGRPSIVVDCGSVTVNALEPGPEELASGRELFQRIGLGPYVHLTVVRDGVKYELAMSYGASLKHEFVPPNEFADQLDPFTLHDRLIAAITAGEAATYELDASSGLPSTWTLDGVEYELVCLQFESTDPSFSGASAKCDPTTDLMG